MAEDRAASLETRSALSRIGLVLLNLLTPGLGLIRAGLVRAGVIFALAPPILLLVLAIITMRAPTLTPTVFLALAGLAAASGALLLIAMSVLTWRSSRLKTERLPWWRRWYSLLGMFLLGQLATSAVIDLHHGLYKPFYLPAESMMPTLAKGDRLVADMRRDGSVKRGDVILFATGETTYIQRVAALAGDRIAMRNGVPVINGKPVRQEPAGRYRTVYGSAVVFKERLPGERLSHYVLDHGEHEFDEMAEKLVPRGHIFMLGDNRDRTADSRVPRAFHGVEMVPVDSVRGRALFRTWAANYRWIGTVID